MIIWLASYPKSGNTLLRSLLASYFFSNDGDFKFNHLNYIEQFPATHHFTKMGVDLSNEVEVYQNFIKAQKLINKENLCKIHTLSISTVYYKKKSKEFYVISRNSFIQLRKNNFWRQYFSV